MTPEAISSYARASMEARREASRQGETLARPSLVDRLSNGIDLRRLAEAIRRTIPRLSHGIDPRGLSEAIRRTISRTPTARIYDPK